MNFLVWVVIVSFMKAADLQAAREEKREIFLDWFLPSPHKTTFQQVQSLALWHFLDLLISTSLHLSLNILVQATSISLLKNPDTSQVVSHIHCPSTHSPS